MRLLIKLKSKQKIARIFPYHLKIQGLIYNLIKNTQFANLHNKKFYKFFCFSNIFSDKNTGLYNLIICSPNREFLTLLAQKLIQKEDITIERNKFILKGVKFFNSKIILKNLKITTISPIIIRIPKEKYQDYNIAPKIPYPYLFWRPKYPFEAFIKQLEDNIFKKYKQYHQEDNIFKKYKQYHQKEIKEFPIFQRFVFKKSVSIPLKIHNKKVIFIGSIWDFYFDFIDAKLKKILEFALDCGFGENNSKGFGFVNVLIKKLPA